MTQPFSQIVRPSSRPSPKKRGRRSGSGLVVALVTLLVITSIMGSIMHARLAELRQTRQTAIQVQAQWLADAAVERAAARLSADTKYAGESWKIDLPGSNSGTELRGTVEIRIERGDSEKSTQIVVQANYPDDSQRRVSAQRAVSVSTPRKNFPASDSRKETDE
jgi:Tfp pilus assembly protein PilX